MEKKAEDGVGYRGLVVMEPQDCDVPVEMKNTTRGKGRDVFQQIRVQRAEGSFQWTIVAIGPNTDLLQDDFLIFLFFIFSFSPLISFSFVHTKYEDGRLG